MGAKFVSNEKSLFLWCYVLALTTGCENPRVQPAMGEAIPTQSFHQKIDWIANAYFQDPDVIELCKTIEANDLRRMEQLIVTGTDVNAIGKDNMTPLLWAFPDNKLERFTRLLEAGANPNVLIESDLGVPHAFRAGSSVLHMCADTQFPGYFQAAMEHGGDPNLRNADGNQVIHLIIRYGSSNPLEKIKLAIRKGADINAFDSIGVTPPIVAVGSFQQYDLALQLLKLGADPSALRENSPAKLIHTMAAKREDIKYASPDVQAAYHRLLDYLIEQGEDFEKACEDQERWHMWGLTRQAQSNALMAAEAAKVRRERAQQKEKDEQENE